MTPPVRLLHCCSDKRFMGGGGGLGGVMTLLDCSGETNKSDRGWGGGGGGG